MTDGGKRAQLLRARRLVAWLIVLASIGMALTGCQYQHVDPPSSFNLSGTWVLDERESDAAPDPDEIRRREDRDVLRGRQRDARASSAFVVHDFPVVGATRMVIEQDDYSMGIEYDSGAAYRDVTWGERERNYWLIRAGWRNDALVIESSRDPIRGTETMRLEDSGSRLRVEVDVRTGGQDVRVERVFERQ
ncbi:MAG: hypothetical protein OXH52_00720 [Gammaproteobacteria bacterium]|nr:hypothetical protein [Gammaproteobacteria bacterium]